MSTHDDDGDFNFEPVEGLPEVPPDGESILWSGRPNPIQLGNRIFATEWIAIVFGVLAVSSLFSAMLANATAAQHAVVFTMIVAAGALAIAFALFWGWLVATNTVYTITNQRIVIRHGVTMPMSINVPFAKIAKASAKVRSDGSGDVSIAFLAENHVSWFAIYPHLRPWTWNGVQPAMRCIPDAANVAIILHEALAAHAANSGDAYVGARPKRQVRTTRTTASGAKPALPGLATARSA